MVVPQRRWSTRRSPSAHDVVARAYAELPDMAATSLAECKRVDAHNTRMYDRKLAAIKRYGNDVVTVHGVAPPPVRYVDEYRAWVARNTPVRADAQARAVEALLQHTPPLRVNVDYLPQDAVERARGLPQPTDSPASVGENNRYRVLADDELIRASKCWCMWVDYCNDRAYARNSRRAREARRRLASVGVVQTISAEQARENNYQRRVRIKARAVYVSAEQQALAVERLHDHQFRLYAAYEPQDAIHRASALEGVATDVLAELSPDSPPPPPSAPEAFEEPPAFAVFAIPPPPPPASAPVKPASH